MRSGPRQDGAKNPRAAPRRWADAAAGAVVWGSAELAAGANFK